MDKYFYKKIFLFIQSRVKYYNLDLNDKIIYTEFGTGSYIFSPIIALLANVKHVYAINKDSSYGTFEDNRKQLENILELLNIDISKLTLVKTKEQKHLNEVDIITNSGFVRPIDKFTIDNIKNTAVIPLMWETWEFRDADIDLNYAKNKEILVLGTNESNLGLNIFNYRGFLVSKLMFDCKMGVHDDRILLLGSGRLGDGIADFLKKTNVNFKWITFDKKQMEEYENYLITPNMITNDLLKDIDAIIFAEHFYNKKLLGKNAIIDSDLLYQLNPNIQLIHICGDVDLNQIEKYNFAIHPKNVKPFGYMSVTGDYLGPKSTIELVTAGFKVGEVMSTYRQKYSFKKAYLKSIENYLVDDFKGGYIEI